MVKSINLNNRIVVFTALILLISIHLSYADGEAFTINVPNAQGEYTALVITKSGDGFVGPQGEYYPTFPTVAQLQVIYGLTTTNSTEVSNGYIEPPIQDMPPRVNYFYDHLAPYGRWIRHNTYGWVWSPNNLSADWRPYTDDGHWEFTDDGWTWASDYPWGWACFHYGRWFYDDQDGWLWYPDTVWAPCWVLWRYDNDWIGWAPLPPEVIWREDIGLEFNNYSFNRIPWHHYSFCHSHDFTDKHIKKHIAQAPENGNIINHTNVTITNIKRVNNHVINRLPFEERIVKTAGHPINRLRILETSTPGGHQIAGNELMIFRPRFIIKSKLPVAPPQERMNYVNPAIDKGSGLKVFNGTNNQHQRLLLQEHIPQKGNHPTEVTNKEQILQKQKVELKANQEQLDRERQGEQKRQELQVKTSGGTSQTAQAGNIQIKNIQGPTDGKSTSLKVLNQGTEQVSQGKRRGLGANQVRKIPEGQLQKRKQEQQKGTSSAATQTIQGDNIQMKNIQVSRDKESIPQYSNAVAP